MRKGGDRGTTWQLASVDNTEVPAPGSVPLFASPHIPTLLVAAEVSMAEDGQWLVRCTRCPATLSQPAAATGHWQYYNTRWYHWCGTPGKWNLAREHLPPQEESESV